MLTKVRKIVNILTHIESRNNLDLVSMLKNIYTS